MGVVLILSDFLGYVSYTKYRKGDIHLSTETQRPVDTAHYPHTWSIQFDGEHRFTMQEQHFVAGIWVPLNGRVVWAKDMATLTKWRLLNQ